MGELGESAASGLALNDLGHFLADSTNLRRAGVGGLLDLVGATLGEGDGEQTQEVVIGGLHSNVGLDQRLPLADEGAQLVGGKVQAVEVGQAVLALDLIHTKLDLAESVVLVVLQICEGNLKDTTLQRVVRVLQTAGAVDEGLADTSSPLAFILTPNVGTQASFRRKSRLENRGRKGRGRLTRESGRSREPWKR